MTIEPFWIGIGAAVLAGVLTFMMPVEVRRVNQTVVIAIIVVLIFVAAFSLFDFNAAIIVGVVVSVLAVIYRDVMRFLRRTVYGFTKYTRRDYWYRRIGQGLVGSGRRGRRRQE